MTTDTSSQSSRADSACAAPAPPDVVPARRRYGDLLQAAYSRGWTDGCFAAPFEPADRADLADPVSRGRSPADFALSLWGHQEGQPPAGLALNAPLWYARGVAEALEVAARR